MIARKVEKYKIPYSLTLNLDQTPISFVPGSSCSQAQIGSDSVPIAGSNDKIILTATFPITINGMFSHMQLIYRGKTSKSFPQVKFADSFIFSANEKHCSND